MPDGTTAPAVDTTEKFVVRYRYGEGILLEGNTRPFKEEIKSAWPRWRWFRSLGQWGVQRTRDSVLSRSKVEGYAKGLQAAGMPNVEVDYEAPEVNDLRDFAELKKERDERSLDRADRLSDRAERLHDKAAAEFGASSAAVAGIPLGQPILVGHHSEKRHRRDLDRSHRAMRRGVEANKQAKHTEWTERSTRLRHAKSQTPSFAIRRLKELTAERRKVEVVLTGKTPKGWRGEVPHGPAGGDYGERLKLRRAELDNQISFYRATVEKDHVPITPEMVTAGKVRVGDVVMTEFGPARVGRLRKSSILAQHRRGPNSAPFSRVWVPRSLLAEREGTASPPSSAARKKLSKDQKNKGLLEITAKHKITPEESWPQILRVKAVLVDAERQGLGAEMFTWLRQNQIQRSDTVGEAYGYARGVVAFERGSWPPPPTRGSYYGKDHFNGLLSSLKHHAAIEELVRVAKAWPQEMEELTKGRYRFWFNDGRIAALALQSIHDLRLSLMADVVRGARPTLAMARQARDSAVASATSQLARLKTLLDPSLYDPSSSAEEVYPRLCEIDPEGAGRVLNEVFGVEFPDDQKRAAYSLCGGDTTLAKVKEKATEEAEDRRERKAELAALRHADARDLIAIRADASQRGELTPRRFNAAYKRLHPKLTSEERRRRSMTLRRTTSGIQATVRGPRDAGFTGPSVKGDEGDAIAALWTLVKEAAGSTKGTVTTEKTSSLTKLRTGPTPPAPPTAVDIEEIARRHGITKDRRWPTSESLRAAMLEALRHGEGPRMLRWLQRHRIQQPKYLAEHYGYASGVIALENKAWPPRPIRGKTYGLHYFLGLVDSLEHESVVAELRDYAATWPKRMEEITHGAFRLWFDEKYDRDARSLIEDEHRSQAIVIPTEKKPDVARAKRVRELTLRVATKLLSTMRTMADPSLYDPASNPREVFPTLCSVDSTAAGRVLKDVFGIAFPENLRLRASQLCTGERTLDEVTQEAAEETKQARTKEVASEVERQQALEREAKVLAASTAVSTVTPTPPSTTEPRKESGRMWSVDEEGFALTSPRGEGPRVVVPSGHQPNLIDMGPPDHGVLERQRAEELARRRGAPKNEATPLLESTTTEEPVPPTETTQDATKSDEPVARLEYVDVATGSSAHPSEPGTLSTGRVLATVDGEVVEIDREDLLGRGTDADPRKRTYRFDEESPADYEAQAKAKKADRKKRPKKSKGAVPKGPRKTFDSASKAAALFYDNNAAFFDHIPDPWDGLRDWMDGLEVRVGKGHRKLAQTPAGKRILGNRHASQAIRSALAYLFGGAKGRRWEAVPWDQVDRLGEALESYFQAPSDGGQPGLTWRPFTGTVRVEDLDAMSPEQRDAIRRQEAVKEIGEQLDPLRTAYERAKECLPKAVRQVIERRISEWSRWVKNPQEIPEYACEPDPETMGHLCNYPAVAGELAQLRRSCDDAYDPAWAASESKSGTPGFPDTSAGEDEVAPTEGVSAAACCGTSKPIPRSSAPVVSKPKTTRVKKPPKKTKKQSTTTARKKATKSAAMTPAEKRKARAELRKATTQERERRAAERSAQRLQCSAVAAEAQAKTIDLDPYRKRVTAAGKAVKEAEGNAAKLEKTVASARRAAAALRGKAVAPKDRRAARKKLEDARCALKVAKSKLTQRKRDHRRATTELRTAKTRAEKRQAVANKKKRRAERATSRAAALGKGGK